jgi:hypothetical protein
VSELHSRYFYPNVRYMDLPIGRAVWEVTIILIAPTGSIIVVLTRYSPDINLGSGFAGKNQLKAPTFLIDNDPGMRNVSRQ